MGPSGSPHPGAILKPHASRGLRVFRARTLKQTTLEGGTQRTIPEGALVARRAGQSRVRSRCRPGLRARRLRRPRDGRPAWSLNRRAHCLRPVAVPRHRRSPCRHEAAAAARPRRGRQAQRRTSASPVEPRFRHGSVQGPGPPRRPQAAAQRTEDAAGTDEQLRPPARRAARPLLVRPQRRPHQQIPPRLPRRSLGGGGTGSTASPAAPSPPAWRGFARRGKVQRADRGSGIPAKT